MVMDAFVHIHEERYYSALNTVDQINQRLDAMDSVKFASQLRRWMPSLTEMINKATKEEVTWHTCHAYLCTTFFLTTNGAFCAVNPVPRSVCWFVVVRCMLEVCFFVLL